LLDTLTPLQHRRCNTQVEHSVLSGFVTPINRALDGAALAHLLSPTTLHGAQAVNAVANQQAQIIAYDDDSKPMMLTTLPMLLLLPPLRRQRGAPAADHAAVMQ
jgi:DHA2 family multidrug resistance protein